MAAAPPFKVYTAAGEYVAACKYASDAVAICAISGSGTVRHGHKHIVWREGSEEISASESYDQAADIILSRITGRAS